MVDVLDTHTLWVRPQWCTREEEGVEDVRHREDLSIESPGRVPGIYESFPHPESRVANSFD